MLASVLGTSEGVVSVSSWVSEEERCPAEIRREGAAISRALFGTAWVMACSYSAVPSSVLLALSISLKTLSSFAFSEGPWGVEILGSVVSVLSFDGLVLALGNGEMAIGGATCMIDGMSA